MSFPTERDIAEPIVGSLTRVARELGLDVRDAQVLSVGANVVVHLAPSPVVARVATLTAEMRANSGSAMAYLQREHDISIALSARGLNSITPTDLVDPGPHNIDGMQFLLLRHQPLEPVDLSSANHAMLAARAFVEMSETLADIELGPNPYGANSDRGYPWTEIDTLLQTVTSTTDRSAIDRITEVLEELRATDPDDTRQLVHGDAHKNNVAFTGGQIIWFDFEDANYRPRAWDLGTLRRSWPAAGEEACRLLGVDSDSASMRWHFELRELYALLWSRLMSQRLERARQPAAARLAAWMEAH